MTHATPTLTFLGATDTVTGSRYLLQAGGRRIMIDCGLFQGYKQLRERNRLPLPVDPGSIDAVILTHAHLDHSGYLPALVREGFRGRIHSTPETAQLCGLILPDSARLLEEAAQFSRRHGSRHAEPKPLYTEADAEAALARFTTHEFDVPVELGGGVTVTFVRAGHILGAAQLMLRVGETTLWFTGDLGRQDDPLMRAPEPPRAIDVLVTESTYGNRSHAHTDPEAELGEIVRRVIGRGGVLLLPAFAVGRTESLLLHLSRLKEKGLIPPVPVYINSPMAASATEIYGEHPEEFRVSPGDFERMSTLAKVVHTVDESKLLNLRGGPMIILSASGMLEGGRILHHLMAYGSDPRNGIALTGFQAGGTRGAALQRGERTLRIYGRDIPIEAEVVSIESLSAHADADGILAWMRGAPRPPRQVYITHGEPDAADTLRARIKRELGWEARVPGYLEEVSLDRIPSRHHRRVQSDGRAIVSTG
ncbi:MBL fold metallo-hydrolase RNA specificity domain-containing protein [Galbitalea soli]|uniref:MBL fold metallo-hydrolase n=1 Tax=Galbitalea soli TaxID=1268042 RepID=A0A7C9PNW1_9MICO|nr:MBL fold metallo-hydrolase [Galbitalea soli]NEM91689.1 MBL fold metallo-hydrolase [Galbitalea soli]NYJ30385.1 metallo-beta-lactamase family protein [Galbitalea soli]